MLRQTRSLIDTATKLLLQADRFPERTKREIIKDLNNYLIEYEKNHWQASGRLAKMGLPRWLVLRIRRLKTMTGMGTTDAPA
jgi:hypothetical protein